MYNLPRFEKLSNEDLKSLIEKRESYNKTLVRIKYSRLIVFGLASLIVTATYYFSLANLWYFISFFGVSIILLISFLSGYNKYLLERDIEKNQKYCGYFQVISKKDNSYVKDGDSSSSSRFVFRAYLKFNDKKIEHFDCKSEKEFKSFRVGDICYLEQSEYSKYILSFKRINPSEEELQRKMNIYHPPEKAGKTAKTSSEDNS
jgi:flagellar biosynthesis/type III secretory pathway chaperone